jgi:hypothetical protein
VTAKEFLRRVTGGGGDLLGLLLEILERCGGRYCVIGGLGVNAYADPVVSLDLDIVVSAAQIDAVCRAAGEEGLAVERFAHSVNLAGSGSDLRIQLQLDPRYQGFLSRAVAKDVLGYAMNVASVEDVLQGKVWAFSDRDRRPSKRQKDLADILRLLESDPTLEGQLPDSVREALP